MFSKYVKLLCFLLVLPSFLGNPQRSQVEIGLRGNSFGLENFLFRSYESTEAADPTVKPKRIRPAANPRVTTRDRGQTFGLENLSAQMYESSRLKPAGSKPFQDHTKRKPIEPTAEPNKIKETFTIKQVTVDVAQDAEISTPETTERIRKRIMMRRRRKRPPNGIQSERNSEITGNAILKPLRIPIYPQVPKVEIKTKLPDDGAGDRLQTADVKLLTTTQTENNAPEETTVEEEPTTAITEKSTMSTTSITIATEKPPPINLKTFLKQQTETLSLSELLQTQNLSLADLLRGNTDASTILKAKQSAASSTPATSTTVRRKQFNRIDLVKTESPPKTIEVIEVSTSRPNYNGFQPKIPRIKPSQPGKTKTKEENEEEIIQSIKRPVYASNPAESEPQSRLSELRMKLRNFQKKLNSPTPPEITSTQPARDETIEPVFPGSKTETPLYKKNRVSFKSANNPELSLILPNKIKPDSENQKRPERLSNWTSRFPSIKRFGQDKLKVSDTLVKPSIIPTVTAEENNKSFQESEEPKTTTKIDELPEEETRKPESKDELIELLKSGQNADRLQEILNSRNMTIQELLDNREKPPLQINISTLFSNQQKHVSTSTQPTLFDSLPDFEMSEIDDPDQTYDEPEAEESAPNIARVQLISSREPKQYELPVSEKSDTQLNLQPDDLTADTSNSEDSALWKLSEKSIYYGSSYGYGDFPAIPQTEKPNILRTTKLTEGDILLLETIRRSQETNRKFKLEFKDYVPEEEPQTEDIEKSYIPPAVKSAIIASGVVMGIALFVFIAIFAACGWKQRQIRLKSSSSTLGGTLSKREKSKRTLSPVSFKDTHSYKKTIDFDDETSDSGTSNTSSYLWSTLKNTFTSRASTLKSRMEKDEKLREDKVTLRRNESRRKESRSDDRSITDEAYLAKKIDRDRNVINTSFNFNRSPSNNNVNHFNECVHGY